MFIVDVIPLTYLPVSEPQILSYFFNSSLERGSIVEVPLARKKVIAVVWCSENISQRKAILKKADFALKPIGKVIAKKPLSKKISFFLANFISHYYFSPLSLSLKQVLPKKLKSLARDLEKSDYSEPRGNTFLNLNKKDSRKIETLEKNFEEIFKKINQNLKKKKQILFLVPTVFHLSFYSKKLSAHNFNSNKLIIFQSNLKTKEFISLWKGIDNGKILFVIGTRSSLFLPWKNLGLIVVVEPNDSAYKSWDQKPYYQSLAIAKKLSFFYNAEVAYYQNY